MSILIVSGSGNVGGETTIELARRGLEVTALLRGGQDHPRSGRLLDAGVRVIDGDLRKPEGLRNALSGVDTVFCSATSMPAATDDGLRKVDHEGTLALIEAAEAEGVKRFVYVSYSGNIRLDSPLERAKRECEEHLLSSRMETVILRPSYFMEVWLSPMLGFDPVNGTARIYGSGEAKVSYISSSNVADFGVATITGKLEAKDTILELGGPEPLSLLGVVRIFEQNLGKRISVEHVPVEALQGQYQSPDPLQKTFGALMLAYAQGDVVQSAVPNAQKYGIQLRSVHEYASRISSPAPVG
jgi:NADH dehydrogenase